MGLSQSRCDAAAGAKDQTPGMAAFDAASMAAVPDEPEPPAHMSLPLPVKYEDMHKEAFAILRPEIFDGMRFEFTKSPNAKFRLTHSIFMGQQDLTGEAGASTGLKVPAGNYEFTASVDDVRTGMMGRISTDGRLIGIVRHEVNDYFNVFGQAMISNAPGYGYGMQGMFDVNWRGSDYQGQVKFGTNQFYGLTYMQSVTPALSLGGEAFWIGTQRKCGVGLAMRYVMMDQPGPSAAAAAGDMVGDIGGMDMAAGAGPSGSILSAQIAPSTGLMIINYVQRVSDKLSMAADFMYNWQSKESTSLVGYDYNMRQCKLQGRVSSDGVISAFLVERLNLGLNFILSAEVDYPKKNYKTGFGLTVGTSI